MTHHFLKLKRSRLNDCWPSYGRGLSSGRQRWLGALRSRVMMPTGRESCESKLECLLVELYWFREHSFLASLNPRWGLISPPLPHSIYRPCRGPQGFCDGYFLCYFGRCAHSLGIGIFKAASKPVI